MIGLGLNYKNHPTQASLLVSVSGLMAITYSIYSGDGLLDPGIMGYMLLILLGTLLLGVRYTPWLTLASILCLTFVGVMQANGFLHPITHTLSPSNLLPISLFLISATLIAWSILHNLKIKYAKLRASEIELRASFELTILGWSKALDSRDEKTGDHTQRVVEMSEKLARSMHYPESDMLNFRYGAILHDIGKIAIPDAILLKSGPLSEEEWEVMRGHPLKAEEILSQIPNLGSALDIPKHHHEQWDGIGYPYHRKGKDIPLAARIFTIVDVWDALTNDHSYRKAWSPEMAMEYIGNQSGKQFDPEVVTVFLELLNSDRQKFINKQQTKPLIVLE
jgi:HD-GYP domain-containing protein (c-di-GMP phosphodiesterase class II)